MRKRLFKHFNFIYRASRWLTQRMTSNGLLLLTAAVISATVGVDTRSNLNSSIFSMFALLLILGALLSSRFRLNISLKRHLPEFSTIGETLHYRLEIDNKGTKALEEISLLDQLEDRPPDYNTFVQTPPPENLSNNRFDRYIGYPKWVWLSRIRRGGQLKPLQIGTVPPGERKTINLKLTPLRRGTISFSGTTLLRPEPLGLFNSLRKKTNADQLTVLPKRYRINPLMLPGNSILQPGGVSLASHVGESEEFVSLRDYRPGDPLRTIHWKSWAKTGKPIVRQTQPEFFVRNALILDTFIPLEQSPLFEEAVAVATSLVHSVDTQESLLDLIFVGNRPYRFTMGRGVGHRNELLKLLANTEATPNQAFELLHQTVLGHISELSGAIVILCHWDDERADLLQTLSMHRVETLTLVVCPDQSHVIDTIEQSGCTALPVNRVAEILEAL